MVCNANSEASVLAPGKQAVITIGLAVCTTHRSIDQCASTCRRLGDWTSAAYTTTLCRQLASRNAASDTSTLHRPGLSASQRSPPLAGGAVIIPIVAKDWPQIDIVGGTLLEVASTTKLADTTRALVGNGNNGVQGTAASQLTIVGVGDAIGTADGLVDARASTGSRHGAQSRGDGLGSSHTSTSCSNSRLVARALAYDGDGEARGTAAGKEAIAGVGDTVGAADRAVDHGAGTSLGRKLLGLGCNGLNLHWRGGSCCCCKPCCCNRE